MMQAINELKEMDPESSILFLDSGFSLGATNISGKNPPNGAELRQHFIEQLGLPVDTNYDLQVLTDEFAEKDEKKLCDELYRIFSVKALNKVQKTILNEHWQRIYTTNYDDVVEAHRLEVKTRPLAFDVSEPLPNKLPHGSIIHLHGSIRRISSHGLQDSLVLGENSYVKQHIIQSPWYRQFQQDIAFAHAVYIIGYSLSDYHISALLLENPEIAARTFFIQGTKHDSIFCRRTAQYGHTLFIGTEGFADALANAQRPAIPTPDHLQSFRSLAPMKDKQASARPTAAEIYNLLVYGDFNPGRLARSQPEESYAIARVDKVRDAANEIEGKPALVIESRIGNGKTVFIHLLAFHLSARGWKCFLFKPGNPNIVKDISALTGFEKLVVFIEQYSAAQDDLGRLRAALPKARFVVEVRTGSYEVRFHELSKILPDPHGRISLNSLSPLEVKSFRRLCEKAGLPLSSDKNPRELRDFLVDLFKSKAIREKMDHALKPLLDKLPARRMLTMTMLIATTHATVDTAFIRSVVGDDPFKVLKPFEDLSSEIFEISANTFRVRSAIFSLFVIDQFIETDEISSAVVKVTLTAARHRDERPYRILMSNMMTYGRLQRILRDKKDFNSIIIDIYEQLRYDERVNDEPLFWLQYAIVMTEIHKLDEADKFITTAYCKAEKSPGFQTYQIDTQAFRIALMRAIEEPRGSNVSNIDKIIDGMERANAMLKDSSHRAYIIRVLEYVQPFVKARRGDLINSDRAALQLWLPEVEKSLSSLPDTFKSETGSEKIRHEIIAATALLINYN